jgi:hypothetical protein
LKHLRQIVASQMIAHHGVRPAIARIHVDAMDADELWFRFCYYRTHPGMELSTESPNPREVNESSTRFSRPQRRRQAVGTQLHSREVPRRVMPESGKKEPGPEAGAFFAPAVLPKSEIKNLEKLEA